MSLKIAFIHEEPDAYRTPFYRKLKDNSELTVDIFYCRHGKPTRGTTGKNIHAGKVLPYISFKLPFFPTRLELNPSLWNELNRNNYDLIVTGGYFPPTMLLGILWARVKNIPYILICENNLLNRPGPLRMMARNLFLPGIIKKAAALLPLGREQKRYLEKYGRKSSGMFFFPNVTDNDFFTTESAKYRKRKKKIKNDLGLSGKYTVLFVGRFSPEKGLFTLIRAHQKILEKKKDVNLLLVGSGALKEKLRKLVKSKRTKNVKFAGGIPNKKLPRYYGISDIFVLPSTFEPWGVVVNEAMASSLPVVLSDKVGSGGDLLKEGENGLSFTAGNVEELSEALLKLLEEPQLLENMGNKSRDIISDYNYEYCRINLLKAIKSICIT